jgi:hypothetical protein
VNPTIAEFVAAANKCSSLPYDSDISMSVAHAAMLDCERASILASGGFDD